jgi:hypothetical protein
MQKHGGSVVRYAIVTALVTTVPIVRTAATVKLPQDHNKCFNQQGHALKYRSFAITDLLMQLSEIGGMNTGSGTPVEYGSCDS